MIALIALIVAAGLGPAGQPLGGPVLSVPEARRGSVGEIVHVPVTLASGGAELAGISFSIEYDVTCLDPDVNNDSTLDFFIWSAPPGFITSASFGDDNRLDVVIADVSPPIGILPDGVVVQVGFIGLCAPSPISSSVSTPITFSTLLPPTFSDPFGDDIAGSAQDGAVRLWEGGVLFADGFETEDTAAWSSTSP